MGKYLEDVIELIGKRFGRLVVIEKDSTSKRTKWICQCDCGNIKSIQQCHLKSGATVSCGCYQKEKASEYNTTHGKTGHSLNNRWCAMKQRCYNPKCKSYKNYGARGITVCDEWLNDFDSFYNWSIENGYQEDLELDRIDNDKGYSPDNCRWVKAVTNNHNRRNTAMIDGIPLKEFCEIHNVKYTTIHDRYYRLKKKGIEPTTENILK